jgi:3,4-dihydroxy-2-butanone 4-phosphate synthase
MQHEFSQIDDALQALRDGRIIIVVDDQDRENEGDFIAAADKLTAKTIEFMITHGRGQVCMPILPEVAARLHLGPMVERNTPSNPLYRSGRPQNVPHRHQCRRTSQDRACDHRSINRAR